MMAAGCGGSATPATDSGVDANLVRDSGTVADAASGDSSNPIDSSALVDAANIDSSALIDAAPDTSYPADGAVDGGGHNCPATIPNGTCSGTTYPNTCWYGTDSRYFCRTKAVCKSATWQVTLPLEGCDGTMPVGCPDECLCPRNYLLAGWGVLRDLRVFQSILRLWLHGRHDARVGLHLRPERLSRAAPRRGGLLFRVNDVPVLPVFADRPVPGRAVALGMIPVSAPLPINPDAARPRRRRPCRPVRRGLH